MGGRSSCRSTARPALASPSDRAAKVQRWRIHWSSFANDGAPRAWCLVQTRRPTRVVAVDGGAGAARAPLGRHLLLMPLLTRRCNSSVNSRLLLPSMHVRTELRRPIPRFPSSRHKGSQGEAPSLGPAPTDGAHAGAARRFGLCYSQSRSGAFLWTPLRFFLPPPQKNTCIRRARVRKLGALERELGGGGLGLVTPYKSRAAHRSGRLGAAACVAGWTRQTADSNLDCGNRGVFFCRAIPNSILNEAIHLQFLSGLFEPSRRRPFVRPLGTISASLRDAHESK